MVRDWYRNTPDRTITNREFVFLDDDLKDTLKEYCKKYRMKKSAVLRTALVRYLINEGYEFNDS